MTHPLARGSLFAGYRIIERLGTTVFQVEDACGRMAALRVLPNAAPELVARCFTEACSASEIGSPAIARTYDVGVFLDRAFVVTELVEAQSLARYVRRMGELPLEDAIRIVQSVARALAALHDRGLAHGSLDLDSVLVDDDDSERITLHNFGLAALGGGDPMTCVELPLPIYTSPEQCRASAAYDTRSDLYALGCMFFQLLTGHPPFRSLCLGELATSHMMAPAPVLPASVPPEVRELVTAMLAKCPQDRPDATYVVQTLSAVLDDLEPATVPRANWRWVAALAVTFCLAIPATYKYAAEKVPDLFHAVDVTSLPR